MFGPILRGKRVSLRPPRSEETKTYLEWFADMEVTRYLGRRSPPSLQEAKEWFRKVAGTRTSSSGSSRSTAHRSGAPASTPSTG